MTDASLVSHKVVRRIDDDEVFIAPIEAVMLSKLRYYQMGKSDRHLRDIRHMMRISGDLVDLVDLGEIERWATRLGLDEVRKQVTEIRARLTWM